MHLTWCPSEGSQVNLAGNGLSGSPACKPLRVAELKRRFLATLLPLTLSDVVEACSTGATQTLYRRCTGATQALHRRYTGATQALHRPYTAAFGNLQHWSRRPDLT
ncbi:hypothetical protein ElyMa_003308600 [Elysia marginata]|uniref:Uncharacterized protein n=1 Tax=Elysia marginata TaxID=1093978 RepID=A0AAV4JDA9_9GAST|nr:hypothetical protein ElyMa_003308600 [Elysia marginata]